MLKLSRLLFFATVLFCPPSRAEISFQKVNYPLKIFDVGSTATVNFSYIDMRYGDWLKKGLDRNTPLDVAPALTGLVNKSPRGPEAQPLPTSNLPKPELEFFQVINERNADGKTTADLNKKSPEEVLQTAKNNTQIFEIMYDTVVDKAVQQINLNPDRVAQIPTEIDTSNAHFEIPGSVVQQALEANNSMLAEVEPSGRYLLSVFDLRKYHCQVLEERVSSYFASKPEKRRLKNGSIYVISQIRQNQAADFTRASAIFGKRPDSVIHQHTLYADHVIQAMETTFALYGEGPRTRLVLRSTLAMKKELFYPVIRELVLNGFGTVTIGIAKVVNGALSMTTSSSSSPDVDKLLAPAEKQMDEDNRCDTGLALGLIGYTQSVFTSFIDFAKK